MQADLYINPDLGRYGVTDFNKKAIKDILRIGEETALKHRTQISSVLKGIGVR